MNKKVLLTLSAIIAVVMMSFTFANDTFDNNKDINDNCTEWQEWESTAIYIKTCEYSGGGSGYYKLKNDNDEDVRISFTLYFNNGKKSKLSTNIQAYSETSGASCFSCARKNGGVDQWSITKMAFEGEEGYW